MPNASAPPASVARRPGLALALLAALALLVAPLTASPAEAAPGERAVAEYEMIEDINADRRSRGLGALRYDRDLRNLARDWSATMSSQGLSHRPSFWNHYPSGWRSAGENIGTSSMRGSLSDTTAWMHDYLMGSSGHRANILKGDFTHVGVGIHVDGDTAWYTINFLGDPDRAAKEPEPGPGEYTSGDTGVATEPAPDTLGDYEVTGFYDVPAVGAHTDAIVRMADDGVISGYADGTFRPGSSLTRAQLASLLVRHLDLEAAGAIPSFADVAGDNPHGEAIAIAASHDLVSGYEDGTFRPSSPLNRAQTAGILVRAFDVPEAGGADFSDVDADHTHADAIASAAEHGLMSGYGNGTFGPDDRLTRGQIATILDRQAD
jgi:uncharacterized protein YkwD